MSDEPNKGEIPYPLNFVSPRGVQWTMNCPVSHFRRTADVCDRLLILESLMATVLQKLGCSFEELPVDKEDLPEIIGNAIAYAIKTRSVYDEKQDVILSTPESVAALKKESTMAKAKMGGDWKPKPDRFSEASTSQHRVSPKQLDFSNGDGEEKVASKKRSAKCMLPATYSTTEKPDGSFLHEMKTEEKKPRSMLRVYSKNKNSLIRKNEVKKDEENH